MSSAELSHASTQTESRVREDCLACKLVGSVAFAGVGLYALQVAQKDGAFARVRPPGGSLIGGRLAALLGVETQYQPGGTSDSSRDGLQSQEKPDVQGECQPVPVDPVSTVTPLPSTTIVMLLTVCLTFWNILSSFAATGVTVMLDELADDLHIAENNLQWTINSFQLPMGCVILVAGKAADTWGRKRIFLAGILLSGIFFLISGFMKKEIAFYLCRAVSGVGNALIAGSNIGLSLLPLIGVFFLAHDLIESGEHVDRRIDWAGGLLFTSGSVLLFFCLSQSISEAHGWHTRYIIALLVLSFALLSAAILWVYYLEQKTNYPPIMRLSIVTRNNGRVGVVYYVAFCCIACYAGLQFTSLILYQRYEDLKPTVLMLRFLPGPVVGTICNVGVGLLASRVPGIWFFIVGSLSTAIANVLYAAMDETASYWKYQFIAQACCVIGPDLVVAIGYIYITGLVESWEVAIAGASLQFFISLGFVMGPSVSTLIYKSLVYKKHGSALTQEESRKNADLLASLRASFWLWAALCFTSTIVTLIFLRDMGKTSSKLQSKVVEGHSPHPTDDKASSMPDAAADGGASLVASTRERDAGY